MCTPRVVSVVVITSKASHGGAQGVMVCNMVGMIIELLDMVSGGGLCENWDEERGMGDLIAALNMHVSSHRRAVG